MHKSTSYIGDTVGNSGIASDLYRDDILGINAILSVISYVKKYNHHFTIGNIRVGCDNEKAGWISGDYNPNVLSTFKHFNLVRAIRSLN